MSLKRVKEELGQTIYDPSSWPDVMQQICELAGSKGAALLQSDIRTPDIPRTAGVSDLFKSYFANGWHLRDIRAVRGVPLLARGQKVVSDQDILKPDEIKRSEFYNECLAVEGMKWFAVVGFQAGPALWGLSIQRTPREGPFSPADIRLLERLSGSLTEVATLSQAMGHTAIVSVLSALDALSHPAVAVDRFGKVIAVNDKATSAIGDTFEIRQNRLFVADPNARTELDTALSRLGQISDGEPLFVSPIIARRNGRLSILKVLTVPPIARSPFLGARAIITIEEAPRPTIPDTRLLGRLWNLTPAEIRICALLIDGHSLETISDELNISKETVRNQLKSVLWKTGTHRQAELVALLARMPF